MQTEVYTLPEWDFVGGATQKRRFALFHAQNRSCDLPQGKCNFAVTPYLNATAQPYISKDFNISISDDGLTNIVIVTLTPQETVNMEGRYEYQLTIKDSKGNVSIPHKGIMQVYRNINQSAILL